MFLERQLNFLLWDHPPCCYFFRLLNTRPCSGFHHCDTNSSRRSGDKVIKCKEGHIFSDLSPLCLCVRWCLLVHLRGGIVTRFIKNAHIYLGLCLCSVSSCQLPLINKIYSDPTVTLYSRTLGMYTASMPELLKVSRFDVWKVSLMWTPIFPQLSESKTGRQHGIVLVLLQSALRQSLFFNFHCLLSLC